MGECVVHTGQHYDERMSQVFFDQLNIPKPVYNLQVGSGSHGQQTGAMLQGVEEVLLKEKPDDVLVYGDTNSTLAGALAAAKLHIPVAHVEAGLRSHNRTMPEEINRIVTDRLSSLLLCPTSVAVENLHAEGVTAGVHQVGDVMFDAALTFSEAAGAAVDPLGQFHLQPETFALLTCHRAENTDDPVRLASIVRAVSQLVRELPVVCPLHPRTRKQLLAARLAFGDGVQIVEPVSYLEMLLLEKNAAVILTDSGGVQKEAFFFGTPCVTLRNETEWPETLEVGANVLAGADEQAIVAGTREQRAKSGSLPDAGPFYGEGKAAAATAKWIAATPSN